MPAAHSLDLRLEGIRSDDLGTKRISRLITNSLRGDVKPTPSDSFRDQASVTQFKNAKMFWNHFLFRKRSDTHTILPINNIEVLQQTCRALPFLQTVAHENCEKMVLRNNLCFGKCSSIHVPGNEDGHYAFCSYCFPVRFTRKTVQLNCKGSLQVTKVVMMVEDCQCEVQKGSHPHQPGPFLMDPSHLGNRAEESRHDTYY
ncbi:CER1 protein, partial [Atractosteus spatula]|nr:CER1 protein [Atractosteus spatula]